MEPDAVNHACAPARPCPPPPSRDGAQAILRYAKVFATRPELIPTSWATVEKVGWGFQAVGWGGGAGSEARRFSTFADAPRTSSPLLTPPVAARRAELAAPGVPLLLRRGVPRLHLPAGASCILGPPRDVHAVRRKAFQGGAPWRQDGPRACRVVHRLRPQGEARGGGAGICSGAASTLAAARAAPPPRPSPAQHCLITPPTHPSTHPLPPLPPGGDFVLLQGPGVVCCIPGGPGGNSWPRRAWQLGRRCDPSWRGCPSASTC